MAINGTDGNDELVTTASGDTLNGRAGNDLLLATFALSSLNGGSGDDRFVAEATGGHHMNGGTGNDSFELSASSGNQIRGNAGGDEFILVAGSNGNVLRGGEGYDRFELSMSNNNELWSGSEGGSFSLRDCEDIRIHGSAQDDNVIFWGGNRLIEITTGAGNDSFLMTELSSIIFGNLNGGAGDDFFEFNSFTGILNGGSGSDLIRLIFYGATTINGGTGDDQIMAGFSDESLGSSIFYGGAGDDTLFSHGGAILDGGAGNDILDAADGWLGRPSASSLYGRAGDDSLRMSLHFSSVAQGGAGNDQFFMYAVNDSTLDGGSGDDVFNFDSASHNTLIGGSGHDIFGTQYWSRDNTITDFDRKGGSAGGAEDQLDFRGLFESVGQPNASLDELVQTGYLSVDTSASMTGSAARDTVVRVDQDGAAGAEAAFTVVTLQDVVLGTTGADADNWLM